ncbi:hypothetical protein CsSME_00037949 [Camellia sinensis var. sinensis]
MLILEMRWTHFVSVLLSLIFFDFDQKNKILFMTMTDDDGFRGIHIIRAFLKAWSATCGSTSNGPSMIIPGN